MSGHHTLHSSHAHTHTQTAANQPHNLNQRTHCTAVAFPSIPLFPRSFLRARAAVLSSVQEKINIHRPDFSQPFWLPHSLPVADLRGQAAQPPGLRHGLRERAGVEAAHGRQRAAHGERVEGRRAPQRLRPRRLFPAHVVPGRRRAAGGGACDVITSEWNKEKGGERVCVSVWVRCV
jgi:hypothetical protein